MKIKQSRNNIWMGESLGSRAPAANSRRINPNEFRRPLSFSDSQKRRKTKS